MDNITVGQLIAVAIKIAGFIGAIGVIYGAVIKWLNKVLEKKFEFLNIKITESIDKLSSKIDFVDYSANKNFLVQVINDIDSGQTLSETTLERFYESYDHYTHDCGGNGYIKAKVEALERDGKLSRYL